MLNNYSTPFSITSLMECMQKEGFSTKATERIKEREYRPFREIKDGYPRYIISLDRFRDQQEGVKHINAIDLFLGIEQIS